MKKLFRIILPVLFSTTAYAIVTTVSIGPVWLSGTHQQTLLLTSEAQETYTMHHFNGVLGEYGLFLGMQKRLSQVLEMQMGFSFLTNSDVRLNGDIWDDADPTFNNHNYRYFIHHTAIGVKGKWLIDTDFPIIPWFGATIGVGLNSAYGFTNSPVIFQASPMPNFAGKTITSLTYSVEVGLQRAISKNWQLGLNYEFSDWGKSQLGKSTGQTLGHGISLSHFYTNGFLLNLSYIS